MSKIICDICGTTYPDTAESCPICGCSRDATAALLGEDLLQEENVKGKSSLFSAKKKEIFDFDEVNAEPEEEDEEEEEGDSYDEEEEEEEAPRQNTFVIILLTILIAGLLIVAGFIFVRYFLPNMKSTEETLPPETTAMVQETTLETTEPTIPCESLLMTSGGVAELNEAGQFFLLHVKAMPENTTDEIIYKSGNESIATVSEDGKITAIAEGETTIFISCGQSNLECPVVVKFVEETVPPTTEAPVVEETTLPVVADVPNPDVVLKLKEKDFSLGVYYQHTLELDCDLEQNQVEWSSEHPHIAKVDENGVVTAVKDGTTAITAKYGDQEVQCMVRCVWY